MAVSAFILAGEASADRLAAQLMPAAEEIFGDIHWFGIGGPLMEAKGLEALDDMERLSIIGLSEAIGRIYSLSKLADRLVETILERQPEFIFTIDTKGFSLRLAKRLKKALKGREYRPQLIHMVAPTVWAWGAWRARKFGQYFDHLFCLFPFEPDYFKDFDIRAVFVGHPDADESFRAMPQTSSGLELLLLPGSRKGEITGHLPVMLAACDRLLKQMPDLHIRMALLAYLHPSAQPFLDNSGLQAKITLTDEPVKAAFKKAHFMIASSGTVTLEAAIAGVPGVVIYRLSLLNRLFARLFYKPDTPVLPDIILKTHAFPFLISPHLSADKLYQLTHAGLADITARNTEMAAISDMLKQCLCPDKKNFSHRLTQAMKALKR